MEEVWHILTADNHPALTNCEEEDSDDDLMAISLQAHQGTEGARTIRFRGFIAGQEAFMLLDSGSSHCFISDQLASVFSVSRPLAKPVQVKIANGELITCSLEIPDCMWGLQGHTFRSDFKVLPLGGYDIILGMDWLSLHSPMHIHWAEKWLRFDHKGKEIVLKGIQPAATLGPPVTNMQLKAMHKRESILYMVQLYPVTTLKPPTEPIPTEIQELVDQFCSVFQPIPGLPPHRKGDHTIPLVLGAQPFRLRPYRYNPFQKDEIERQNTELLQKDLIQPSTSPFASPALLVRKKTGDWRLCVDYRRLNALTVKNKYPLPVIDELLDELSGAKWFTSLDMCSGFHQIRMAPGEESKTAFQTHHGHFEYKVMPYGVTGGPATFQAVMNELLAPFLRKFVVVFIDDVLIYSKSWSEHLHHLHQVFSILQHHQFYIKLTKCSFAKQQLHYLGYVISSDGVSTDPSKVQIIANWPPPQSVKELRSFLGMTGYYRKFVKNFGLLAKPLTNLLKKGQQYIWTSAEDSSF